MIVMKVFETYSIGTHNDIACPYDYSTTVQNQGEITDPKYEQRLLHPKVATVDEWGISNETNLSFAIRIGIFHSFDELQFFIGMKHA